MSRPDEDDRAAVDRAFAELVAGYHLTAERPGSGAAKPQVPAGEREEPEDQAVGWADAAPLSPPAVAPPPEPAPAPEPAADERYVPDPLPPLGRPAASALLGWLGITWAAVVVLAAAFGVRFPSWVGWLAVGGFLGGFGVLVSRLPRQRPPGSGDGAVL